MSDLLYSYINDIAERLREPEIYGSASVMIGAGFSKNAIYLGDDDGTLFAVLIDQLTF